MSLNFFLFSSYNCDLEPIHVLFYFVFTCGPSYNYTTSTAWTYCTSNRHLSLYLMSHGLRCLSVWFDNAVHEYVLVRERLRCFQTFPVRTMWCPEGLANTLRITWWMPCLLVYLWGSVQRAGNCEGKYWCFIMLHWYCCHVITMHGAGIGNWCFVRTSHMQLIAKFTTLCRIWRLLCFRASVLHIF